ncbi:MULTISPECIES: glycosyltransferase family 2 protein [Streptomyces]|uniref:glycosyltransferase family 2 protein n=1 Tax=Streptomyces TaxID=1883 RepID=UPI0034394403
MSYRKERARTAGRSPDIGRLAGLTVAELELDAADGTGPRIRPVPGGPPLDTAPPDGDGRRFFALVRLRGRPVGTVVGRVREGDDPASVLARQAADEIVVPDAPERPPAGEIPRATVVVATRERPAQLARALDSLLAQDHPDFEIVVVDNAPVTGSTRELVTSAYAGRGVRHVVEPVPGLASAHNRGVAAATSEVLAFTDDDVVADPHWLTALTRPFGDDPRTACVTGLILPARLTTPAQILLESHGGFAKGFTARDHDPAHPPPDEPLFPFTAGRFGSGANMAFRAGPLRAIGGFDPATGTGTPAGGGDDLYAFVRLLAEGYPLHYTPEAIVWHHHRERWGDLCAQAYGYGVGLTACLTALLVRRPALLPPLLARLPQGLAHARTMTAPRATDTSGPGGVPGAHGTYTYPWPRHLSRLERRGLLYGPLGYVRARLALRRAARPRAER